MIKHLLCYLLLVIAFDAGAQSIATTEKGSLEKLSVNKNNFIIFFLVAIAVFLLAH